MEKRRPGNSHFSHIGSTLEKTLKPFRERYGDGEFREIWAYWSDAVGDEIAKNTKPLSFRDGHLIVTVTNSSWMHHLQFLKEEIRERLNLAHGTTLVRDIRFKIGVL